MPCPQCPICGVKMERLYFHDGTPENLFSCPNNCKSGVDQHVRVRPPATLRNKEGQ